MAMAVNYWAESVERDIDAARAIVTSGEYPGYAILALGRAITDLAGVVSELAAGIKAVEKEEK